MDASTEATPGKTASPLVYEDVDAIPTGNIIEIREGRPGARDYEVPDEAALSALGSVERRTEVGRPHKRPPCGP